MLPPGVWVRVGDTRFYLGEDRIWYAMQVRDEPIEYLQNNARRDLQRMTYRNYYNRNVNDGSMVRFEDRGRSFAQGGRKHSGARTGIISRGNFVGYMWSRGWNWSRRRGMVTCAALPYHKTNKNGNVTSKTGRVWYKMIGKIVFQSTGVEEIRPVLMDSNGRFVVKHLGMVCNPKAPNGGYFGRFGQSRR